MQPHKIVSHEEWLAARKAHLRNEKALTRMRDWSRAERRALPWVKVDKKLRVRHHAGQEDARRPVRRNSQLIVHHFMWRHDLDSGCPSCSLEADHAEGALVHLENHDVSYVRVSRAPLAKLLAYKQAHGLEGRMGVVAGTATSITTITCRSPRSELASGEVYYNYQRMTRGRLRRAAGPERVRQGRARQCVSTPIRATRAATKR